MEVQYIDEQTAELTMIDNNYELLMKPSKKPTVHEPEVFRPVLLSQINQPREKPVAIRKPIKPMKLINRPIDKICFATYDDYLNYKKLYG